MAPTSLRITKRVQTQRSQHKKTGKREQGDSNKGHDEAAALTVRNPSSPLPAIAMSPNSFVKKIMVPSGSLSLRNAFLPTQSKRHWMAE